MPGFKDTFTLRQVIQNLNDIFDGGGSGYVLTRGSTEFDTDWQNNAYGVMHIVGNTTATTISNSDEWTQVAFFSASATKGISFASNELTISRDGDYAITVALSFEGFAADTFVFGIAVDDTVDEDSRIERKTPAADVGALAICTIKGLSVDDTLQLYVKNKALTNNPTITEASFAVHSLSAT